VQQRLQKLLAAAGLASRRHAEAWLRAGRVRVNGQPAKLGDSADPAHDTIEVDGQELRLEPLRYWLLHKPAGVLTSTRDPEGRPTVLALVPERDVRLYPVGRLDRDTEGLLLLTNDGETAQALLHPSLGNEREYEVTVRGTPSPETLGRLARGIRLDDGPTSPAHVAHVRSDAARGATRFTLTLREGRKRQIRRSLDALGHKVLRLVRVRMGPLRLGELAVGEARPLRPGEVRVLRAHAASLRAAAEAGSAGERGAGRGRADAGGPRRGGGLARRQRPGADRLEQDEGEPEAQQEEQRAQGACRHDGPRSCKSRACRSRKLAAGGRRRPRAAMWRLLRTMRERGRAAPRAGIFPRAAPRVRSYRTIAYAISAPFVPDGTVRTAPAPRGSRGARDRCGRRRRHRTCDAGTGASGGPRRSCVRSLSRA